MPMVGTLEDKILEDGQSYQQPDPTPPPQVFNSPSLSDQIDDDEEVDDDDIDIDMDMKINIIPSSPDPSTPQRKEENDEEEAEEEEDVDMDAKHSLCSSTLPTPPVSVRRSFGKKMKPYSCKKLSNFEAKRQSLISNFDPQTFVPPNIDISRYERCLHLLGLWDFATLNFRSVLRKDLLTQLIAYYDREKRRSSVNDIRIQVSRADLARAMHIPVKKTLSLELKEEDKKVLDDPIMKAGLQNFLLGWVVLVGDIGIIPDDAQSASKMIENGDANRVDWAGLLWKMVEREVTNAPKMGVCLYASHLQHLIMHQKPGMFMEEDVLVSNKEVEVKCTDSVNDLTEVTGIVDGLGKEEDSGNAQTIQEGEKQHIDVTFGLGLSGCHENAKEEGRQENWFRNTQNVDGENLLRPCSSQNMEIDLDANIEHCKEENQVTHTNDFTTRFAESSVDLLRCVDANNIPFCPPMQQPIDPSSTEFVGVSSDMHANYFVSNSSVFGNLGKRTDSRFYNDEEDVDDDDDSHSFEHVFRAKRAHTDFDHASCRSIHSIADEVNHFMEEMKKCSNDKDKEIMNCQMHMQYLNQVVQQKSETIEILEGNLLEEHKRVEMVKNQFEHEHMALSHMVVGYQKAIKNIRQQFAEYRRQFPQGDEPLYKVVPGSGGVVLTVREIERQRFEKSESERQSLERKLLEDNRIMNMVLKFSKDWSVKFENHEARTIKIVKRLKMLDEKFKLATGNIRQIKLSNKTLPHSILDER